jgi:hypothetical protein
MTASVADPSERIQWTLSVTLRREMRERKGWQFPAWSLAEIAPDARQPGLVESNPAEAIHDFCWTGLRLSLQRSNAETYWYNLTSQTPSLFVICREDPQYGLVPSMISIDQDESAREQESEGEIFSVPMPRWIIDALERFVMTHYRPEPRGGKRRRKPQAAADE